MDQNYNNTSLREIARCRHLLEGYFEGTLTAQERGELAAWLHAERRNRDMFRRLKEGAGLKEYDMRRRQVNPAAEYKLLIRRMPQAGRRRRRLAVASSVAAAVLVLAVAGIWALNTARPGQKDIPLAATAFSNPKAILYTTDGEKFELDGSQAVQRNSKFVYADSLQQLIYHEDPMAESNTVFAQLDVPHGGEFKMVLPDGTNVWLNSESSIRFPGTFPGNRREVFVCGELYFEVVKDASRPFIVHAGEMRTEVLGTCFGISAYDNEPVWSTVLAEGSVKVSYRNRDITLAPHRKAVLEKDGLTEKPADLVRELAWIRRDFAFESDRLEDVVRRLERWYPVSFRFVDDGLRDDRFTGTVSRDMGIDQILGLIERMNVVSFVRDGEYVNIQPKR